MKRKDNPLDVFVLVLLCILGGFLGRFQHGALDKGRVDPLSSVGQTLVSPIVLPLSSVVRASSDFFFGLFAARRLTDENRRLASLAQVADLYSMQIERLEGEVSRLRAMSGYGELAGKTRLRADVVGYSAFENRITLNVGSNLGVRPGMPVEAPEGLVGTVQAVEASRCQVLLVTSAGLILGAIDLSRNPPPAGLLRGEDSNRLAVTFQDPKAPVAIGDRLVTSGFSDRIPRGIYIGRVIAIDSDEEFGSLRAKVDPAVNLGNLREVIVLK